MQVAEMLWTLMFCLCSLWITSVQSIVDMRDTPKNPNVDLPLKDNSMETGVRNQGKRKTLFARREFHERQSPSAVKLKVRLRPPGRRCYRMMESCLPSMHCCDPCAICNCRFFNTVCYCWKLEQHCHEKS